MGKLLKKMAFKKKMSCYAVLFLLIVVDINGAWSISREEDLELERQLKTLNKLGVKTIRTDYSEIFDCVDIHKQPSLDHPLLKNHKVQMTFDYFSKSMKYSKEKESSSILGKGLGCPIGTVPIRRTQKEDLTRAKAFSKLHSKKYVENSQPLATDFDIFRSAKLVTNKLPTLRFYGIQSYMNIYNPQLSSLDQASSSLMYLAGGLDDAKSDISLGWTVNSVRNGDNFTHLFTYWTADGGRTTGCYDLLCPGFIQTNPHYPLGLRLPSSTYNGTQIDFKLAVSQDPNTGHWWLIVTEVKFGYWPKELFGDQFGFAKELVWGGEVFSARQPFPPMGSGHFPEEDFGGACFMRGVQVQSKAGGDFLDPVFESQAIGRDVDNPSCYNVGPLTNRGGHWGFTFFFGGPGGQC